MAGSIRSSYLIDRQTDPDRLRRVALDEFRKAHSSGRLIAFLGSYATSFLGYGSWDRLVEDFFDLQEKYADDDRKTLIKALRSPAHSSDPAVDRLVRMDLAELATGLDRRANPAEFLRRRKEFMKHFQLKGDRAEVEPRPAIARALLEHLDVDRFMTLNYDLEIEWELLTSAEEKRSEGKTRAKIFSEKLDRGMFSPPRHMSFQCPKTRLQRYLMGRGTITSDVLDRDRSEVLTEFALGTPWRAKRILHLHGRADVPENLILTKRDYRDRYWEAGFSKLPFEYGMRLIFSANPVLFVGIGVKEPDVMRTLEQFLSDNPNRRAVPAFLLWNSPSGEEGGAAVEQERVRRLGLYRQYGIHLLFDRDIADVAGCEDYSTLIEARLPRRLKPALDGLSKRDLQNARRLEEPIKLLGKLSANHATRWISDELRTPQDKINDESNRIDMWLQIGGPEASFANGDLAAERLASGNPIKAIIAEPGSGRGTLAKAIATVLEARNERAPFEKPNRVVLINGSFAIETDSIFGILSGAADNRTAQEEGISRVHSLMKVLKLLRHLDAAELLQMLSAPAGPAGAPEKPAHELRRVTIIVNSMERFIGHDGSALSNELDNLIRILIGFYGRDFRRKWAELEAAVSPDLPEDRLDYPINLILIGTPRVRRYLGAISKEIDYFEIGTAKSGERLLIAEAERIQPTGGAIEVSRCDSYFEAVQAAFGSAVELRDVGPDRLAARRIFLGKVLREKTLADAKVRSPLLCLEIVRTLAFVGQPVEREVLRHVPRIWELTGCESPAALPDAVNVALDDLERLKLILPIKPFVPAGSNRFGLHKSVIAEMRERFGAPLSDSRLSGGFNLSLTAAQAVDSAAPELAWHDDLGQLVDFLAGAFSDPPPADQSAEVAEILRDCREDLPADLRWYKDAQLCGLASEEFSVCLRAALAIMRSYYSVPALLMQANRDLDPWMRDGPLSEHADRLARLLRMANNAAILRDLVRRKMGEKAGRPAAAGEEAARKELGPNAYYPDDLVWLNNELGVVRATQGNLFEAEQAFREAQRINDRWVEPGDRQQNWRRIQLNLCQVGIDRGDIKGTEERLRDLEATVEDQAATFGKPRKAKTAWEYIIKRYAWPPRTSANEPQLQQVRVDPQYPTDLILSVALIQGFRGQCMHLRGALDPAKACLADSLSILARLDELRAYAFFQRQAAALHAALGDKQSARQGLKLCIAAAGPSRQTDIDHSGRVALVQYDLVESVPSRPPWIMQLTESLRYATAGDMFRLQLECMQALAQVHLRHGDTDSALRYTNDAMAVAARCGFDLRTVSLRILMARILAFRGDKDSARELLDAAEHIATKMKYERAVEAAENELIRLG